LRYLDSREDEQQR
jgi:ribosome assembly protein 1